MAFPLWHKPPFLTGIRKTGDIILNFTPSKKSGHYRKILWERGLQQKYSHLKSHFTEKRLSELNNCSLCFALVRSSSHQQAFEQASEALYETLGLVNMVVNREWSVSTNSIEGKLPVARVLVGPHITIHGSDGSLDYDGFWSENWSTGPPMPNWDIGIWEEQFNKLTNGMKKSPWAEDCKLATRKYFEAFSNPNLEESFLDGWRLLELIAVPKLEKYDKKIERVSKVYNQLELPLVTGKHLKFLRNHRPIEANDGETLAYQMAHFITGFLIRYIVNSYSLKSRKDFWKLLDLPIAGKKYLRELELYEVAAKFRNAP